MGQNPRPVWEEQGRNDKNHTNCGKENQKEPQSLQGVKKKKPGRARGRAKVNARRIETGGRAEVLKKRGARAESGRPIKKQGDHGGEVIQRIRKPQ